VTQRLILLLIALGATVSWAAYTVERRAAIKASMAPHVAVATQFGELDGAAYRIDIPANWNHELVVYYHGYSVTPVLLNDSLSPMFSPLLNEGYALIQSAYSQTGWAMEQAYADTEALRKKFIAAHGTPVRSYVMGMSMGGALTAFTIETKPDVYAGALSLCGALTASARLLAHDFATLAAFDHYFPGVIGPLAPVRADFVPTLLEERHFEQALASNPQAAQSLLRVYGSADAKSLAEVLTFDVYIIGELQRRAGGNPFDNSDVVYQGSLDDAELNRNVRRYHADAHAADYLARWYTPTGKLARPMLALHDTGDPLVPAAGVLEYAQIAQQAGHADLFVPQFVARAGHCVFTPAEIGHAFDQLVGWVEHGKHPEVGTLR
jgi:pimeloyl-ACP methyl ester carboxylesterase